MGNDTRQLADLINQRHDCLVALRDVGERQLALIDSGDMTALLKVLSTKQHLIGLLQTLEQQLKPYRDEDPELRTWATREARQHCAARAAECEQMLAEIVAQEQQGESQLTKRRDAAATQLQGVHSAHQARAAYAQQPGARRVRLDLTSDS